MTPTPSAEYDGWQQELLRRVIADASQGENGLELDGLVNRLSDLRRDFETIRMYYQFGIEEVLTKVGILRQEFEQTHAYSPIEHVRSRLKSADSVTAKVLRTGCEPTIPAIRDQIRDIAGIRISCSFVSDVYWIASMLGRQPDVTVVETKDYISNPKPNGYRSLHLIVQIPVFLSDRTENMFVELQIRTIAMDFWASVEHKLSYKYRQALPADLQAELDDAARVATELDSRMSRLRKEIQSFDQDASAQSTAGEALRGATSSPG